MRFRQGWDACGEWFAYSRSGVKPDVLILGKPLGGGLPLSAILVNENLFDAFGVAKHGSTLGGSPIACRLGLEFLKIVEDEGLLEQVRDTGDYLLGRAAGVGERAGGRGARARIAAGAGSGPAGAAGGGARRWRRGTC